VELDDFIEPEVGIAVAVTAAVAAPPVRRALRKGAVYGLAGLLMARDKVASWAGNIRQRAQTTAEQATPAATAPAPAGAS